MLANMAVSHAHLFNVEGSATCLLDLKETHDIIWRETLNVRVAFVGLQKNSTGLALI